MARTSGGFPIFKNGNLGEVLGSIGRPPYGEGVPGVARPGQSVGQLVWESARKIDVGGIKTGYWGDLEGVLSLARSLFQEPGESLVGDEVGGFGQL